MSEFKTYNEQGNQIEVTDKDFTFVQMDKKIHDAKFESKPTTFAKDALKRFSKNKSSVVATAIIGLLVLCALIIPWVSPHNIKVPDLSKTYLPPKLFEAGTGFWDGTKTYKNIVWDPVTDSPSGYKADAVVEILEIRDEFINTANEKAYGGTFIFANDNSKGQLDYLQHYYAINVDTTKDFIVEIDLDDQDDQKDCKLGEYKIVFAIGNKYEWNKGNPTNKEIVLKDWSKEYGTYEFNLSELLKDEGENVVGRVTFYLKPYQETGSNPMSFIGIERLEFKSEELTGYYCPTCAKYYTEEELPENGKCSTKNCKGTIREIQEFLVDASITDSNETVAINKLNDGTFPHKYWSSTGKKYITKVKISYVDFIYDTYQAKLGLQTTTVGKSTLDDYIKLGYCKYDYDEGVTSFEVLDAKRCPFTEIKEQKVEVVNDLTIITLTVDAYIYKLKGYTTMPKFLLGTDNFGYDLVTLSFNGLRTSLILAVCASSVCLLFGLCWGSISGYFGGNVDLFMERFCDILGGVPSTVVLTLAILLMGDGIITFGLALCLTGWMGTAARTRTQFYRFKGREYILASRTLGAKDFRLIFKHILPNALGTIITSSVLVIPGVIFSEASLSYLGIGLQGSNSFGNILSRNQQYLSTYPSLIIFPAIIISLIMISFNLFGNGLRDALNPSLKGSE